MSGENGKVSVEDVAEFYDQFSAAWEQDRGEHSHVGFYDVLSAPDNLLDDKSAAVRIVEEALKFAAISDEESKWPKRVLDVGCGIGGSSRYLSRKYGAHVQGITISEWQVERANYLTGVEGLSDKVYDNFQLKVNLSAVEGLSDKIYDKVSFQLANALDQPFPDGQFDLVWAMESGEHMPDKEKFMQELARVAAPGGLTIMTTCCHRDLLKGETSMQPTEQALLDNIGRACCLLAWCSTADYVRMAQALSLQNIKTADWSANVGPFFSTIIDKLTPVLAQAAFKATKGTTNIHLWLDGFKQELIKYVVITAEKPA